MSDVITLIRETYATNEIGVDVADRSFRPVFCEVDSITRQEWFAAANEGISASYVVRTPAVNYDGEKLAEYRGKVYAIYRAYIRSDVAELYLEERAGLEQ